MNNLHLSFKTQHITHLPKVKKVENVRPAPAIPKRVNSPQPANPLDGITFQLASNVQTQYNQQQNQNVDIGMPIKGHDDILAEYFYDFSTEQKAIA